MDYDLIVEYIIIKLQDRKVADYKLTDFDYIDKYLDTWSDICIPDNYYLDDIVQEAINKIQKRNKFSDCNIPGTGFIEFKESEKYQEAVMLDIMEKKYNKIIKKTIAIPQTTTKINDWSESETNKSWTDTLSRIDNLHNK